MAAPYSEEHSSRNPLRNRSFGGCSTVGLVLRLENQSSNVFSVGVVMSNVTKDAQLVQIANPAV